MLAHVAGIPVEEALMVAPALLAGVTMIIGYAWVTAARITVKGHEPGAPGHQKTAMPSLNCSSAVRGRPHELDAISPPAATAFAAATPAPRTSPSATT